MSDLGTTPFSAPSISRDVLVLGETPECAAVFEHFLKYLYTGKIHLNFATVVPIVSLADKYNVKDLLKLGLDYMERNVSLACKKNQVSHRVFLTRGAGGWGGQLPPTFAYFGQKLFIQGV